MTKHIILLFMLCFCSQVISSDMSYITKLETAKIVKLLPSFDFKDMTAYKKHVAQQMFNAIIFHVEEIKDLLTEKELLNMFSLIEENKHVLNTRNTDHYLLNIKKYLFATSDISIVRGYVLNTENEPVVPAFLKIKKKMFHCDLKGYFTFYVENKGKYFITIYSPQYYNKKEIIFIDKKINDFKFILRKLK